MVGNLGSIGAQRNFDPHRTLSPRGCHWKVQFVEQLEHAPVGTLYLGSQMLNPGTPRLPREAGAERQSDPPALMGVVDHDRHLGLAVIRLRIVGGERDNSSFQLADQCVPCSRLIEDRIGDAKPDGVEALSQSLWGEAFKERSDRRTVLKVQ
jgi:hypothetical protein